MELDTTAAARRIEADLTLPVRGVRESDIIGERKSGGKKGGEKGGGKGRRKKGKRRRKEEKRKEGERKGNTPGREKEVRDMGRDRENRSR